MGRSAYLRLGNGLTQGFPASRAARVSPVIPADGHPPAGLAGATRAGRRWARAGAAALTGLARLLHPRATLQAFREVGGLLARHRTLTLEMTRREIRGEHAGQILGSSWGIVQPLVMMALYAFVFGVVFQVRVGDTFELPRDFTVYLLSGLVPWLALLQAVGRGVTAVSVNGPIVKQSLFPLELLPVASALAAALPLAVGVSFVVVYTLVAEGGLPATVLLVPLLIAVQLCAMVGLAFALSAIGVFVRDVKQVVPVISLLGIFVLPIVYLPSAVPEIFQPILYLNPASYMVWAWQDALYFGRFEHPWSWLVFGLGSLLLFVTSYRLFRKLKPHFGDVL
jgi:lipopolysaccharide transport system permease protein